MKFAVALLLTLALPAQITQIATSSDGAEIQFASQYGVKGEADPWLAARIYRYASGQPELLARAENIAVGQPAAPYISDDGQTRGWFLYRPCRPIGPCFIARPSGGLILTRNGKTTEYFGQTFRLSRNGRWLFDTGFPALSVGTTLTDLDTGAVTRLNNLYPLHPTHAVADDGTILSYRPGQPPGLMPGDSDTILLASPNSDSAVEVTLPSIVRSAAITPDGRKLVALTSDTLYEIDRETRSRREIYRSEHPLIAFSLSAQGDRFVIQTATQTHIIDTTRTLHTFQGAIAQAVLSADGLTAVLVDASNRLIRFRDGEEQELYSQFPTTAFQSTFGAIPGSLVRLSGGPFDDNLTLTMQNREFPVIAIGNDSYEAQIPWDFDINAGNRFLLTSPDSPFVHSGSIRFNPDPLPAIYTDYPTGNAKAAQADFQSLITAENPAPPGSTIHTWLTGLGELDQPLATGQRGPVANPARPLSPITCFIYGPENKPAVRALEMPFLAYAPGLLGVYQLDLTIPSDWPAGPATLTCRRADGYSGSIATTFIAAQASAKPMNQAPNGSVSSEK